MTFQEISPIIAVVKDFVLMVTATIGATVGIIGLRAWRRQLAGTSKYEMAKKLLGSVYATRDAINAVRSSQFYSEEVPTYHLIVSDEPLTSQQFREYLNIAYQKRWAKFEIAYSAFDTMRAEAEILLGNEIGSLCHQFENCRFYLEQAAHHYFKWIEDIELHKTIPESFRKATETTMGITHESEDDWYGKMLKRVILEFEEALLPTIHCQKIA